MHLTWWKILRTFPTSFSSVTASFLRRSRTTIARSRAHLRLRDVILSSGRHTLWVFREDLARRYLRGAGIEIGPLTFPLRVPPTVRVRYVDRMSREDLIAAEGTALRTAGLDPTAIPEIHVVDGAETLSTFPAQSLDFIVANHVLEHLEDPIGSLENMLRVIRPGGVLLLTLPDARHTFDSRRPRTTVEHVLRDHQDGPDWSRRQHYEEWARAIEGVTEEAEVKARIAEFAAEGARHHFHVWELRDFLALLLAIDLPFELLQAQAYLEEFAVILRRIDHPLL